MHVDLCLKKRSVIPLGLRLLRYARIYTSELKEYACMKIEAKPLSHFLGERGRGTGKVERRRGKWGWKCE